MNLYRLDASIRTTGSHSRAIADLIEGEWRSAHPGSGVIHREIGTTPLPSTAWAAAAGTRMDPERARTPEEEAAVALAGELADELLDADALLFAVPLYNFGVSQHFKTFVDLAITDPRLSAGQPRPALQGKPAVLVTVRGGAYGAGTPREGWDHATGWMRRILADVWGLDLRVVETEFTLVGVNPALDQFAELAAAMRAESELAAVEEGRALAKLVAV